MKIETNNWFEVIIRYDKDVGNGRHKSVKEQYTFSANSFGEAEQKALKNLASLTVDTLEIANINPASYNEVFLSDETKDDIFFIVKVERPTTDAAGKEKTISQTYLVQANTLEAARKNTDTVLNGSIIDYSYKTITKSKTLEVFYQD